MAKRRNKPLRIIVPLALAGLGVIVAISFVSTPGRGSAADESARERPAPSESASDRRASIPGASSVSETTGPSAEPDQTAQDAPPATGDAELEGPPRSSRSPQSDATDEAGPDESDEADGSLAGLRARPWPDPGGDPSRRFEYTQRPLGSIDPDAAHRMLVEFSRYGAGITRLTLARYFETISRQNHIQLQQEYEHASGGTVDGVTPFAADAVLIDGVEARLQAVPDEAGVETRIWKPVDPGADGVEHARAFQAVIENEAGEPILEITRTYRLRPDSYELTIAQRVRNLSGRALDVRLRTYGPVQLPRIAKYPGDRRRVRHGYLVSPEQDPEQRWVQPSGLPSLRNELGQARSEGSADPPRYERITGYWPTEEATQRGWTLVWIAQTNRYFVVAAHDAGINAPTDPKALRAGSEVERFVLNRANTEQQPPVLAFRMTSVPAALAPGASADLGVTLYAGPKAKKIIDRHEPAELAGLDELVVYNIGGACSFCTFAWLSGFLITILRFLHDFVVFDWALAIIALVLIVRTILHPVTKWSQIRVQRFGKQMQEIAPKQKKIQERYPDDKKKQQEEMARLWREEGISPAGLLGCLPMFLQMPVWIALYATLYYAFELRHDGAFFGVFQGAFNNWAFLGDLSEPDQFFRFAKDGFVLPLIGSLQGPINSLNILPLVMAVVLFLHQKYLTPPASPTMTPEQRQQQKIMKVMTVVMLPVFMYNAPSGLALYFVANSTLGIFENRWIRHHIDKHDLLNVERLKEQRKRRPSFMQRLQKLAEEKQRARQKHQAAAQRQQPTSKGRTHDSRQSQQRYKKRR